MQKKDCRSSPLFLRSSIGGQVSSCLLDADILIVVREDVLVGLSFLCHTVRSVLAHTDAMAVALCCDDDIFSFSVPGEVARFKVELFTNLFAGECLAADFDLSDALSFGAGDIWVNLYPMDFRHCAGMGADSANSPLNFPCSRCLWRRRMV